MAGAPSLGGCEVSIMDGYINARLIDVPDEFVTDTSEKKSCHASSIMRTWSNITTCCFR